MSTLLEQIRSLESQNDEVQEEIEDYLKKKHANDQSKIAKLIIGAFVISVALIFLLVFINLGPVDGCTPSDTVTCESKWKDPAVFLSGIVSSIMLPIATLVLGYYFGTEQKNN